MCIAFHLKSELSSKCGKNGYSGALWTGSTKIAEKIGNIFGTDSKSTKAS